MLRRVILGFTAGILVSVSLSGSVGADTIAGNPSLVISQIKVTSSNGQLIVLKNATNITLDMSKYQLEYFNHYDFTKATSSRLIPLTGSLPPHSYYIISDDTFEACYKAVINSVSLGFSSTAGFIGVTGLSQDSPGSVVRRTLQDYVGWSKTSAIGAVTLPASTASSLLRQPDGGEVNLPGSGSWVQVRPDPANNCKYLTVTNVRAVTLEETLSLIEGNEPPFTATEGMGIEDVVTSKSAPLKNQGLMKVRLSELMPNPLGTGNDNQNEYIEIYNPNPVPFDLSGYMLESGVASLKSYTFPDGTILAPLSFRAFYSQDTKLSLSNTTSQARIMDPNGLIVDETQIYSSAKDGEVWMIANGVWGWSVTATPDRANIMNEPKKKTSTSKSSSKNSKKTSLANSTKTTKGSSGVLGVGAVSSYDESDEKTPIHNWTLALVGSLAILYAIYEYRADIGNKLFELRRNFSNWRKFRTKP